MEVNDDGVVYVHKPGANNIPRLDDNVKGGNCSRSQDAAFNPVSSQQDDRYVNLYWSKV